MTTDAAEKRLEIPRTLTVRELADLLAVTPVQVVKVLMTNGVMAAVTQTIDFDTAAVVAVELGFDPVEEGDVVEEGSVPALPGIFTEAADDPATLQARPPVIAFLGHVDHGKTSLLDAIRETAVAEGEAGGITQRIGAYQASVDGRLVTFLDTPGHEAFTQMRARGAEATDIAVLVVAATDGVMPQTREAISHIQAAGVPVIVALNKIDADNANLERVKTQLAEAGMQTEDYGGDVPSVETSALTKQGLPELLETILLVADVQALQANPERTAAGVVLEAELDRRQGSRTTLLVQRGTLRVGDALLVGQTWGKVRAMFNSEGSRIKSAGPSTPVAILGVQGMAAAGDPFRAVGNNRTAKSLYESAKRVRATAEAQVHHAASLDTLFGEISQGTVRELNLVVKADVDGSVEPLRESLEQLTNDEVHVKVIHAGPGAVSDSDVNLALAAKGIVIAFNTTVEPGARKLAHAENVEIRHYGVIYEVVEDVDAAVTGMLEPVDVEMVDAHAEVLQVFSIRRLGNIAGSRSLDGVVRRDQMARVLRNGEPVASGKIGSLRRFQNDVQEVQAGQEFGVGLEGFDTFETGDTLEFFHVEKQSRAPSRSRAPAGR